MARGPKPTGSCDGEPRALLACCGKQSLWPGCPFGESRMWAGFPHFAFSKQRAWQTLDLMGYIRRVRFQNVATSKMLFGVARCRGWEGEWFEGFVFSTVLHNYYCITVCPPPKSSEQFTCLATFLPFDPRIPSMRLSDGDWVVVIQRASGLEEDLNSGLLVPRPALIES